MLEAVEGIFCIVFGSALIPTQNLHACISPDLPFYKYKVKQGVILFSNTRERGRTSNSKSSTPDSIPTNFLKVITR
jgi:hypothetical protein